VPLLVRTQTVHRAVQTVHRAVGPVAYGCVKVIVVRDGSAFVQVRWQCSVPRYYEIASMRRVCGNDLYGARAQPAR
jgi:hypothetical protein